MAERKIKYHGLSLPVVFVEEIKDYIEKHSEYTSVTDFVKQSVRNQMRNNTLHIEVGEHERRIRKLEDLINKVKK